MLSNNFNEIFYPCPLHENHVNLLYLITNPFIEDTGKTHDPTLQKLPSRKFYGRARCKNSLTISSENNYTYTIIFFLYDKISVTKIKEAVKRNTIPIWYT